MMRSIYKIVFALNLSPLIACGTGEPNNSTDDNAAVAAVRSALSNGAIQNKWFSVYSVCGAPIDQEYNSINGGAYQDFEACSILWRAPLGAHETHGAIRDLYAALGWEYGALGYPLTDELPTQPGSGNRFNDFENGVISWSPAGGPINRAPVMSCSKSLVVAKADNQMRLEFAKDNRVYNLTLGTVGVSDYSLNGSEVRNRMYVMPYRMKVRVPIRDVTANVTLHIEILRHLSAGSPQGVLRHFTVSTSDSGPLRERKVREELERQLNALKDVPRSISDVVIPADPLSLKVMVNGDLSAYTDLWGGTLDCML